MGSSVVATLVFGCSRDTADLQTLSMIAPAQLVSHVAAPEPKKAPPARVTMRAANKKGVVFVAEYHNIGYNKSYMFRTPEKFKKDLQRLYDLGFRPVTASEYLNDRMNLPSGASPVVMTFDDSQPSQFKLMKNGDVDPTCAMGIWQEFTKLHPDFPMKATFFVLPRMWDQPKLRHKKVAMLREWGSEIANHTVHHPVLRVKNDEQVKAEIAGGIELLRRYGVKEPPLFAMPYGSNPKNLVLLKMFKYKGRIYQQSGAFLAGANPAPAPGKNLHPFRVPRILAQPGMLGLDYWLDRLEKKAVKPYVAP